MPNIAASFTLILTGLRAAIGAFLSRQTSSQAVVWLGTQAYVPVPPRPATAAIPTETWTLAWTRLGRMIARFTRLYARWQSDTLPKPRPPRPGRATRPATPRLPTPRLPTRRAWIVASVGHHAAGHASQLETLLATPEATEFLTAVPQAGRILRPLCRMLGLTPPACLRLPERPRPPHQKPRAEPRAAPPPHPPARPLPAYVRAAVRAWKPKFG